MAHAETKTTASIFRAFTPHGIIKLHTRPKVGYCWEGALTTRRRDGWRCFVGNIIYDPCFSSAHRSGIVVCPQAPWLKTAVKIRLTKRLPRERGNHGAPSLRLQPWTIELYDGRRCVFVSGATDVAEGKRLNYICGASNEGICLKSTFCGTSGEQLWGFPDRGSEPWTILVAPPTATTLNKRAAVRHAWM